MLESYVVKMTRMVSSIVRNYRRGLLTAGDANVAIAEVYEEACDDLYLNALKLDRLLNAMIREDRTETDKAVAKCIFAYYLQSGTDCLEVDALVIFAYYLATDRVCFKVTRMFKD